MRNPTPAESSPWREIPCLWSAPLMVLTISGHHRAVDFCFPGAIWPLLTPLPLPSPIPTPFLWKAPNSFPISFQHTGELPLFHWNPAQAVTFSEKPSPALPGSRGNPLPPSLLLRWFQQEDGGPDPSAHLRPLPSHFIAGPAHSSGTHSDRNSNQVRFEAAPPGQTDKRALCRALQGQRGQTPGSAALPPDP